MVEKLESNAKLNSKLRLKLKLKLELSFAKKNYRVSGHYVHSSQPTATLQIVPILTHNYVTQKVSHFYRAQNEKKINTLIPT